MITVGSGDVVSAAVAREACNLLIYGPPGVGKTTQALQAFTANGKCYAFYAQCEHGALKSLVGRDLPMPDTLIDTTTGEVVTIVGWELLWSCIEHLRANRGKYLAFVVDNATSWTASTMKLLEDQRYGGKNGWAIPVAIRNCLAILRDECRKLGIHVVYLAHAREPYVEDGITYLGGPALSPKKASSLFYGQVDTMLRADYLPRAGKTERVYYTGGLDWPSEYGFQPPSLLQWFQKNREGVQQAVVPADLGAYLRARRPPYPGL